MGIRIIQDHKEIKGKEEDLKDVEIMAGEKTLKGRYERDPGTGDLRIELETGFGDPETKLNPSQLVTIKLGDGSGGEFHGTFDDRGTFRPR